MKFGERLKNLREEKNITQAELGKILNVSDATVNRYERNLREPDLETIKKLAQFFNCTTDYLLGLTDQPRPEPPQPAKSNGDDDIFAATLAANMEEEYGKKPSPEFLAFAKKLRQQILEDIKKEKGQ